MSNYTNVTFGEDKNTSWHIMWEDIPEKSRVLDVGCSSGNFGQQLIKRKKCEVIGLDLDKEDVNRAKKVLTAAYVLNTETDDLSKLGKFDRIIFADVIEHLVNPSKTLIKIKSLLNPGGKVLFSIPNMAHMSTRLMLLSGKFGYGETGLLDKTHLHFYDDAEIQRVFIEAGYLIDNMSWTEYYTPVKKLRSMLSDYGLKPNNQFIINARNVDAVALQYVGSAAPSKKSGIKVKLPQSSPWVERADTYISNLETQHAQTIADLQHERDALIKNYENILNSKSWKVTKPLRVVKRLRRAHK